MSREGLELLPTVELAFVPSQGTESLVNCVRGRIVRVDAGMIATHDNGNDGVLTLIFGLSIRRRIAHETNLRDNRSSNLTARILQRGVLVKD